MAVTFIVKVPMLVGPALELTVDGKAVKEGSRVCFTMETNAVPVVTAVQYPSGLLVASYVLATGVRRERYSEDDGMTWQ
jgi:hypothetical protein